MIKLSQYKVDRLNAEISAFSSGDLNKYEFLTRKDLKYTPNALDKARFEFSPLGKAFSIGLDKTAQDYQKEGVIKLLKDIRDNLAGHVIKPDDNKKIFNNLLLKYFQLIKNMKEETKDDTSKQRKDDSFDTTPYTQMMKMILKI